MSGGVFMFVKGNKIGALKRGKSRFTDQFFVGQIFGLWTVVDPTLTDKKDKQVLVKCVCGKEQYAYCYRLLNGQTSGCRRCKTSGKNHYKWTGVGDIPGSLLYQLQQNAIASDRTVDVTSEYLWELFQSQNGLCALTGLKLEWITSNTKHKGRTFTASLDRIDNSKDYIRGNVQWVHKDINKLKSDLTQSRFIELCKLVAMYNDND